ncbi:MAG: head to tail connecting protein [Caudovirales sp. ctOwN3]|nr:MAG: head to tail connecting protein [Caudovirales sp. ctOwN3]
MAQENMDLEQGEMVELPDEQSDVIDTPDGGAIIRLQENETDRQLQQEHFANIVDDLDQQELYVLTQDLLEKIKKDKDARKKRDEQYEEGIRRTGLGDDAPGGAQFTGANKVVHPMITEACVDFAARAMKELFPPNGPVRSKVIGKAQKEKLEKAERKAEFMNWQLTEQMPEFRSDLEQLLTQVPLGGAQYLKLYYSHSLKRPTSEFVPIDDVYLPFAASNYYSAERKTHVQYITKYEYQKRVASGMYTDVDLSLPDQIDQTKAAKANDKIEGRTDTTYNEDGLRTVFEISTHADLEGDEFDPYLITVDKATGKCLAVYRNWDPRDDRREPLTNMIEFPFIPWRGAYPIGLTHMIGGLSGAATGALRALLDSAHISNIPTLLKLKGGPNGQNLNPQPTEVTEIEGGVNTDDIRKIIMAMPFNPPSQVLFSLLGFLVDAGKGVVQTSFEKLADGNPNAPVGTTLALIEQGMVVFSAIHSRLHNAMGQTLKVLHRLNSAYLTEEDVVDETGEAMVNPEDFDGPMDVIPVSDPTIFSEAQRFAQISAVQQRATVLPQIYDVRKVEELFLKQLKIPEAEDLLIPRPEPKDLDPVQENVAASVGKPIGALPHQDHIAHLKVHLAFLQSPLFGKNPIIAPMFLPSIVAHIKDHLLMHYMKMTVKGIDIAEEHGLVDGASEMSQADAAVEIMQTLEQAIPREFLGLVTQAFQEAQQYQPQQPQDPAQLAAQVQQASIDQRREQAGQSNAIKQQELSLKQQDMQVRPQTEMAKEMLKQDREDERTKAEILAKLKMNQEDNDTAKELVAVEVASGEKTSLSTGTGINPNP